MAVLWEMCRVHSNRVQYYSQGGPLYFTLKEFLKSRNKTTNFLADSEGDVICQLLSEGWEPYAVIKRESGTEDQNYFRRKLVDGVCP